MLVAKAKLAQTIARIINYDSFKVPAMVITILNYNCNMYIVKATGAHVKTEIFVSKPESAPEREPRRPPD
jgi:hypothetical protein